MIPWCGAFVGSEWSFSAWRWRKWSWWWS